MRHVEMFVSSADLTAAEDQHTITGTAVPWDQWGHTSAGPVLFRKGSLDSDARPPLLLHHDTARPVGVVTDIAEAEHGLRFTARISDTTDGRDALTLARDRALTGVSVGVDITEHEDTQEGLVVTRAHWSELSMVTLPAFDAARIAASAQPEGSPTMTDDERTDLVDAPIITDAPPPENTHADEPAPQTPTAPPLPQSIHATGGLPRTLAEAASRLVAARRAGASVTAALADITTTQWPSAPSYVDDLSSYVLSGTPTTDVFTVRRVSSDAPLYLLRWKVRPIPGKQTAEKTEIATNAAEVEYTQVDPDTYAWGADVSQQAIDRTGGGAVEYVLRAAAQEIAAQLEAAFVGVLMAGGTAGPTGAVDLSVIGEAMAALGKYAADVVIAAPDVYGSLWTELGGGGPSIERVSSDWPRPRLVKSLDVPAGRAIVADRTAAASILSGPGQLRAVETSLLGLNVGAYQYAAHEIVHPEGIILCGPTVRAGQSAPGGKR